MAFDDEIDRLQKRIAPLEGFIIHLSQNLVQPKLVDSGLHRGFRFDDPKLVHFCLLRAVRIVSSLNASIALARSGFSQEIGVILRTMIEHASQIDFMLASLDKDGKLSAKASRFLEDFFADYQRPPVGKRVKLVQKDVHDLVGKHFDEAVQLAGIKTNQRKAATDILSLIYLTFSNYIHGRYPETMDLYGGRPGFFHVNGMRGTPKDRENLEILDTFITTASNTLKDMVVELQLDSLVKADPQLSDWMLK
jgi:hypothetical protein